MNAATDVPTPSIGLEPLDGSPVYTPGVRYDIRLRLRFFLAIAPSGFACSKWVQYARGPSPVASNLEHVLV